MVNFTFTATAEKKSTKGVTSSPSDSPSIYNLCTKKDTRLKRTLDLNGYVKFVSLPWEKKCTPLRHGRKTIVVPT